MLGWIVAIVAAVVVLVVVACVYVAAYVGLGYADAAVSGRCPSCGLESLETIFHGITAGPTRFRCTSCGGEFRESVDGPLVSI